MANGKVKWFNATKGFGFITPDQGGSDVFVHITALQDGNIEARDFNEGTPVSYELQESRGKMAAKNLKVLH